MASVLTATVAVYTYTTILPVANDALNNRSGPINATPRQTAGVSSVPATPQVRDTVASIPAQPIVRPLIEVFPATRLPGDVIISTTFDGNAVHPSDLIGRDTVISNLGQRICIRPSANHGPSQHVRNHKITGPANSSFDIVDDSGNVVTRRWIGPNGRQIRDVDFTNHGHSKDHPEWPHQHGSREMKQ